VRNSKVPSCLVEVGFYSSAKEGKKLETKEYQQQLAKGIAEGIRSYISE
jgi:N-acetylmuramoyl-L-alanine amidase